MGVLSCTVTSQTHRALAVLGVLKGQRWRSVPWERRARAYCRVPRVPRTAPNRQRAAGEPPPAPRHCSALHRVGGAVLFVVAVSRPQAPSNELSGEAISKGTLSCSIQRSAWTVEVISAATKLVGSSATAGRGPGGAERPPAPSDAIVLFDGSNLSRWRAQTHRREVDRQGRIRGGEAGTGMLSPRSRSATCSPHRMAGAHAPKVKARSAASGIFLMGSTS